MKKILLILGGIFVVGAFYSAKKIQSLSNVVGQLHAKFKRASSVRISGGKLTANIDFEVINPTAINLDISQSLITLTKVLFYNRFGKFIGEALINRTNLNIPANSSKVITGLPLSINITAALPEMLALLINASATDIKTKLVFEGLGSSYTTGLSGLTQLNYNE